MEHHANPLLIQAAVYFAAAVVAVLIAHRLGLGSVAGYLLAGVAIGPWGLKARRRRSQDIRAFAELGVVFLLFVIGLELEPRAALEHARAGSPRSACRRSSAPSPRSRWSAGLPAPTCASAIIAGMALALSSTALALQPLTERGRACHPRRPGDVRDPAVPGPRRHPDARAAAAASAPRASAGFAWHDFAVSRRRDRGDAGIAATISSRPVFRHIARTRLREIFTAFALLLVLGIALGFEAAGLSMALGAFLAGVLLAESEYRHEIEAAVEPFKGLLLGLFFISVGMSADFGVLLASPLLIIGLVVGLFAVKGARAVADRAPRAAFRRPSCRCSCCCSRQGGEFAFVLLGHGATGSVDARRPRRRR